jgi:hypothetical protein
VIIVLFNARTAAFSDGIGDPLTGEVGVREKC